MKTLRGKLILNTIFASIALFLLGGVGFYVVFTSAHGDAAGAGLQRVLLSTFLRVDSYIVERSREFDAFSKNSNVLEELSATGCTHKDGPAVLSLPFLKNGWERIIVVDQAGDVCASSDGGSALYQEEKNALGDALRGIHVQTDMISVAGALQPVQIQAIPIMNGTGGVQGALLGRLTPKELTRTLLDVKAPVQLVTASGLVLSSIKPEDLSSDKGLYPDQLSVWNFASTLPSTDYGVLWSSDTPYVVGVAHEPGVFGYGGKGWKLVAIEQQAVFLANGSAVLGMLFFGFLSVLLGLLFFGRMPWRFLRELRQVTFYTEQQLRGVTEFVPRDKELELRSVYTVIERLAMRYNVLARTRDDSVIKLAQDADAYREDRDRYAVMIGAMREGAIAIDNDGIVTLCNLSAASILGRNRDEVIGKHYSKILKLYLDEDLHKEFDALEKALISGGMFSEEGPYYVRQPTGGGLPVRMQSTVIRRGVDRAAIGIFVLMRDVGKELAVEQAKNEFISVTSHQMRTPLATMRWHIERLLKPGAPPSAKTLRDYLERIERNNKRMIRLTEALLDVSRIDLEVAKAKEVEVDIPDAVKEVFEEIGEEVIKERKISQDYEGIKGQKIQCDPYLVRVVFENFIENAIAYTKPGGQIDIKVGMDGDSLHIDVSDNGIGIAADMKPKIFTKFVRGKDAIAMSPEGTGLGLYITKSLVERAGGKIWFTSARNEGTTFSVRFPLGDPNNN